MGETPGEEEKAKVGTEQDEDIKKKDFTFAIKSSSFPQAHDRAGSREFVHHPGKQPVHHQSAEEPIGPAGEGTSLPASLQQGCCSDCSWQCGSECKVSSYERGVKKHK